MKILITIWLTAIATFAFTSIYILSNQERINAPGELGEVFSSVGIMLFASLAVITAIGLIIHFSKNKK